MRYGSAMMDRSIMACNKPSGVPCAVGARVKPMLTCASPPGAAGGCADPDEGKNPAAVALGKLGGKKVERREPLSSRQHGGRLSPRKLLGNDGVSPAASSRPKWNL